MLGDSDRRDQPGWILPFSFVAIAAFLRGAYLLLYARRIPLYSVPLVDAKIYAAWADDIASGDWLSLGEGVFYRAPLYPYFLAGVHLVFGHSIPWVYLLQLLMGLGILLLTWRLGAKLGGPAGGAFALVLLALYGPLMAAESKMLTITLGLFLHLMSVWAALRFAERNSRVTGLFAGILLGLSSLVRPQWVLLAAFLPALMAEKPRRVLRWWPFALGVVLMIAPVTLRNRIVGGDWVLISSNGGMTFYQGNNEENKSGLLTVVRRFDLMGSAVHQRELERTAAERETGRSMMPSEISAFWARQGLEFILSRPGGWLTLEARKLYRLVTSYEYADNYSYYIERDQLWPLRAAFLPFGVLLSLGVLGAVWCRPCRRNERAVLVSAALGIVSCLVFFVSSRYRMDAVPALAILGGLALSRLRRPGGISGRKRWIGPIAAGVVFAASFLPAGPPARSQESISQLQVGHALESQGRLMDAEQAYRQAIGMLPSNVIAWSNLASLLERRDGPEEALAFISEAPVGSVRAHPVTQYAIGRLSMRLGRDDDAAVWLMRAIRGNPEMWEAHERLASIREGQRRFREAEAHLLDAIALAPGRADLWARLGYSRIQLREYESARDAFMELLRLEPGNPDAILNLVVCEFHMGELEAAVARLAELGDAAGDDPLALYYRGLLSWRMSGRNDGLAAAAESDLSRVLEMEPGNFRALYYMTLACFKAGRVEDPVHLWEKAWGSEIREVLQALMIWLRGRSARAWGADLSEGEDRALGLIEATPLGRTVAERIRDTITEE